MKPFVHIKFVSRTVKAIFKQIGCNKMREVTNVEQAGFCDMMEKRSFPIDHSLANERRVIILIARNSDL